MPLSGAVPPGQRLVLGSDGHLHLEMCLGQALLDTPLEDALALAQAHAQLVQEELEAVERGSAPPNAHGGRPDLGRAEDEADAADEDGDTDSRQPPSMEAVLLSLASDDGFSACAFIDESAGTLVIEDPAQQWLACLWPSAHPGCLNLACTLLERTADEVQAQATDLQRALSLNAAVVLGPAVELALEEDSGHLLLLSTLQPGPVLEDGVQAVKENLGRLLLIRDELQPLLDPEPSGAGRPAPALPVDGLHPAISKIRG